MQQVDNHTGTLHSQVALRSPVVGTRNHRDKRAAFHSIRKGSRILHSLLVCPEGESCPARGFHPGHLTSWDRLT